MKKIVSLLLVVTLVLGIVTTTFAAQETTDVSVYEMNVDNSIPDKDAVSKIQESYAKAGKACQVAVVYYDMDGILQNVAVKNKSNEDTLDISAQNDTGKIKVFMYDAAGVPTTNQEPIRVLAIGNSHTVDATSYLADIAAMEGVNLQVRIATINGSYFSKHWRAWSADTEDGKKMYKDNNEKVDIDHFLEDGTKYDYITIQQRATDSQSNEMYMDKAEELVKYIREKQPEAEILIYKSWANEKGSPDTQFVEGFNGDHDLMVEKLDSCVENARKELGKLKTASGLEVSPGGKPLRYIPGGDAVALAEQNELFVSEHSGEGTWNDAHTSFTAENMENKYPDRVSLYRDGIHMSNKYGKYLIALVWYRCLTGNSVENNNYMRNGWPISEEGRKIINATAQKAVENTGIWE